MRTEKCHFWIGRFDSEDRYFDFVGEDVNYYELEDDDAPISKFIVSQGETWIDHDFMESGFEKPQQSLQSQFDKYSYAAAWGKELERISAGLNLKNINTLIFLNEDQISEPKSIEEPGIKLTYIGVIAYEI